MKEVNYEEVRKALARKDFFEYCKLKAPDFYKEDRYHLKELASKLQWFIESDKKIMVVNMPPRHGKSRTATLFVQWLFGVYGSSIKVMTGSYNEILSGTFAKQVRDTIAEIPTKGILSYCDIFPHTRIKRGEASASKWALENSEQTNYLATSPTSTATGFGCNIMIIDDLIKSAAEAYNENNLNKQIEWFTSTMLQRTENGFKLIIIMTRWSTNDLAGFILKNYEDVVHINYKAVLDNGEMLCEDILSKEDYELKTRNMNKDIVLANYQQEPIDIKGRLYSGFKTYDGKLPKFKYIRSYTDTADMGSDYHCSYVYGVTFQNEAYILDILFTDKPMEFTEPATAELFVRNNVNLAKIESNNGGRGFARNVIRILEKDYHTNKVVVKWFTQTQNKVARILSNSTWCMEHIYFPVGWENRWPDLYEDLMRYQRTGKNAHDDAEDALTGVCEDVNDIIRLDVGADSYFTNFSV